MVAGIRLEPDYKVGGAKQFLLGLRGDTSACRTTGSKMWCQSIVTVVNDIVLIADHIYTILR